MYFTLPAHTDPRDTIHEKPVVVLCHMFLALQRALALGVDALVKRVPHKLLLWNLAQPSLAVDPSFIFRRVLVAYGHDAGDATAVLAEPLHFLEGGQAGSIGHRFMIEFIPRFIGVLYGVTFSTSILYPA